MTAPAAVGVIGAGAMGMGVVRSLRRHAFPTIVRDIRPEAEEEAARLGAIIARSPADLAQRCGVAILLLVDDRQIETVLFGADGAASAFQHGSIVVVSATVDPLYVEALPPRLAANGVAIVDAPVSGGPAKASAGTLTMMVSGDAADRSRCAAVFSAIAGTVFEVGERPGVAASFKIVNNLLAAANLAAGAEAVALARRVGLDPQQVFEIVCSSSGASWIFEDRMRRALADDYAPRAAARILAKDVGIAVDLARRLGVESAFAGAAQRAFLETLAAGYSEEDDAAIFKWFAHRVGVPPPGA